MSNKISTNIILLKHGKEKVKLYEPTAFLITSNFSLILKDSRKSFCVGDRHKFNTIDIIEYQKVNHKTKKNVQARKGKSGFCGKSKSQIITKLMTKGTDFEKKGKCTYELCSPMLKGAWCDLNSVGKLLKKHDKYLNSKCNCQIQVMFNSRRFHLEGAGIKIKMDKNFKSTQTAGN